MISISYPSLPAAIDAEKMLIGSALLDNDRFGDFEYLTEDHFYHPMHRAVFKAMQALHARSEPLDAVLIANETAKLNNGNDSALDIRATTIAQIAIGMPQGIALQEYIGLVVEKYKLRSVIRRLNAVLAEALQADATIEAITTQVSQTAAEVEEFAASGSNGGLGGFDTFATVIDRDVMPYLAKLNSPDGVASEKATTGFNLLDKSIGGGFTKGDFVVIAGKTSSGKSALALQAAFNAAKAGHTAAFLAGEMTVRENALRVLSQITKQTNLASAVHLDRTEYDLMVEWAQYVREVPLYLDHRITDIRTLAAHARQLKRKANLRLLVVDYLQIFKPDLEQAAKRSRFEAISQVSFDLKRLAMELDITVIGVSQMNRVGGKASSPSMHDSDGSSQIEKDASIYIMVDREENTPNVKIRIEKGRNTGLAAMNATFIGRCVRFEIE